METLTLDDLRIKPQKVELAEGVEVWVRPLTQIERELCQGAARAASRALRKKLIDHKSEEYRLLVRDELKEYPREQLEAYWVDNKIIAKAAEINRLSLEARDETYIPEPEGPDVTTADIEKWETQTQEIENQREENVRLAVESAMTELAEKAKQLSFDEVAADTQEALLEFILSKEWQSEFAAQMIARATFLDDKLTKSAFKTTSEVKELRPDILKLITDSHFGLLVPPEAIKN